MDRRRFVTRVGLVAVGVVLGALSSLAMLKALLLVSVVLLGYKNDYAVDPMAFVVYGALGRSARNWLMSNLERTKYRVVSSM